MSRMKASPRRPIILKRRKLPFQRSEPDVSLTKAAQTAGAQSFPDGVHIMDHPSMPHTQVVVIPKTADLQCVIDALTAKGKQRGAQGPNKFILLSGSGGVQQGVNAIGGANEDAAFGLLGAVRTTSDSVAFSSDAANLPLKSIVETDSKNQMTRKHVDGDGGLLDESLTNIQWLGKVSTCPDLAKNESNKENPGGITQCQQTKLHEEEMVAVQDLSSKRPPYSYMAMIQFAINSDKNRRMTLKEIYNWIEDHFPYFRNVAKPGWKNSIRHNLSLHDMFIREATEDGKTSYWTIKPESNRCLTLDQVYKPLTEPAAAPYLQTTQVCYQQQQKRVLPELRKPVPGTTERKMKPLLPRTDSYLVPIQLPLAPSLFLPTSSTLPLSTPQHSSSYINLSSSSGGKRVRIAPKVQQSESSSVAVSTPAKKMKEESVCFPVSTEPCSSKRKEMSSSRRKQRLFPPSTEEPVLLFPDSTFFDSGLASDISAFHEGEMEVEPEQRHEVQSEGESCTFKTPIKSSHPASSTPSKALEPWKVTPVGKGSCNMLDFSPIRTPQRPEQATLSFSNTPFKDLPLFSSPRELLASCSRESGPANRSFTEGLVLDTMNDSLSKILVDISFSALDDEDLNMANISWSQFIPELK